MYYENLFYFMELDLLMVMIVMGGAIILKRMPSPKVWPSNP